MNYQELNWEISQCKENLKATDYKAIKFPKELFPKVNMLQSELKGKNGEAL